MTRITLAFLLLVALATPAAAQTKKQTQPAPASSVGFRAYGFFDTTATAASKSFDAVFGSSQVFSGGGGAEIDVWRKLFLRIAVSYGQRTGSRVFVDDSGNVFTLNIPMTVTMTPIEGGAGWRFASKSRITPYIGGGFVSLGYQETSTLSQSGDNVDEHYLGGEGFGGVDIALGKNGKKKSGFFVGGEAQYRHIGVPDVSSSVMTQFNDTDLGGFTVRVLVGFGVR
jgi:opacity protein-like surface antigen